MLRPKDGEIRQCWWLCQSAFCGLQLGFFFQLFGQQCANVKLFARLSDKRENQVTVLSIAYDLRGQNPCLMGKKRGKAGGRTSFYHLWGWSSLSHSLLIYNTNLRTVFMIYSWMSWMFPPFVNHGCLALSLWYPHPSLCWPMPHFSSITLYLVLRLESILKDQW